MTKPQIQHVLDHLIDHGYITDAVAQHVFKIRRLAARIHELQLIGVQVTRRFRRDALGQRYTYYSLDETERGLERLYRSQGYRPSTPVAA
jgi:hypothetical protein